MAAIFDQFGNYAGDDGMGDDMPMPTPKPAMDPEVARLLARYPAPNFYNRPLVAGISPKALVDRTKQTMMQAPEALRDVGRIGVSLSPASIIPVWQAIGEAGVTDVSKRGAEALYKAVNDQENAARIAKEREAAPTVQQLMEKYSAPLQAKTPGGQAVQQGMTKLLFDDLKLPMVPAGPRGSGFVASGERRPLLTPNDARAILGETNRVATQVRDIPTDFTNAQSGFRRIDPITNKPTYGVKLQGAAESVGDTVQRRQARGLNPIPGVPEVFQPETQLYAVKPGGGNFPTSMGATKTIEELSNKSPIYSYLHAAAPDLDYTPVKDIPGLGKTAYVEWKMNVLDGSQKNAFDTFLENEVKSAAKPLDEWAKEYPILVEQPGFQKLQNTPNLPAVIHFSDLNKDTKDAIFNSASDKFTKEWNETHADNPLAQIPGSSLDVGKVVEAYRDWVTKGPHLNYITKQLGTGIKGDPFVKAAEKGVFVGDPDRLTDDYYRNQAQRAAEVSRESAERAHSLDVRTKNPEIGNQTATTEMGKIVENMSDASINPDYWNKDYRTSQNPPSLTRDQNTNEWVSKRGTEESRKLGTFSEEQAQRWHNALLADEWYTGPEFPYMQRVQPDVPIYEIQDRYADILGLENVRKNVFHQLIKGEIAPEDLKKVDMVAGINMTHKRLMAEEKAKQNDKKAYTAWRYERSQQLPAVINYTQPVGITPAGSKMVVFDKAFIDANPQSYIRDFSVLTKDLNFCLASGGHGTTAYPGRHAPLVEPHTGIAPRGNDRTDSGYIESAKRGDSIYPAVYGPDGSAQAALEVKLNIGNLDQIQQDMRRHLLSQGINDISNLPPSVQRFLQNGYEQDMETAIQEYPELQKIVDQNTTYRVNQIKGENNKRVDARFEQPIRDWLNQNSDKLIRNVSDTHNLPNTLDVKQDSPEDAVKFNPFFDRDTVRGIMEDLTQQAQMSAQMDLINILDTLADPRVVPPGDQMDFSDWVHETVGETLGNGDKNGFIAALDSSKVNDQVLKDVDKAWKIYRNRDGEAVVEGLGGKRFIGEEDVVEAARQMGIPDSVLKPPLKTDEEIAQMSAADLLQEVNRASLRFDRAESINRRQKDGAPPLYDEQQLSDYADMVRDAWNDARVREFSVESAANKLLKSTEGHFGNYNIDSIQNIIDRLESDTHVRRLYELSGLDLFPRNSDAGEEKFNVLKQQVIARLMDAMEAEKMRELTEPSHVQQLQRAKDVLDQVHEHFDRLEGLPVGSKSSINIPMQSRIDRIENNGFFRELLAPLTTEERYMVNQAFTQGKDITVPDALDLPVTRILPSDAPQEIVGEVGERRMSSQFNASITASPRAQQYMTAVWNDIRNSQRYQDAGSELARMRVVQDMVFENSQALGAGYNTPAQMGLTRPAYQYIQDKLTDIWSNMENAARQMGTAELTGGEHPAFVTAAHQALVQNGVLPEGNAITPADVYGHIYGRVRRGETQPREVTDLAQALRDDGTIQNIFRQMGYDEDTMFGLAQSLDNWITNYQNTLGNEAPLAQPAAAPQTIANDLLTQDIEPDGQLNLRAVHDTMYALQNNLLDYPGIRGINPDQQAQLSTAVLELMADRLVQQGFPLPDFLHPTIAQQAQQLRAPPAEINVDDLNLFEPDPGHPANAPARQAATPEQLDLLNRLHDNYLQQLQNPEQATLFFNDFMAQFPQLQGQERAVMDMIEIRVTELRDAQEQLRQNPEGLARGGLVRPLLRNPQLANLSYKYNAYLH